MSDPYSCCVASSLNKNTSACQEKFKDYNGDDCNQYMVQYCMNSKMNSPECLSWMSAAVKNNPMRPVPSVTYKRYCSANNNYSNPECQSYCTLGSQYGLQTVCDSLKSSFCSTNKDNSLCKPPNNDNNDDNNDNNNDNDNNDNDNIDNTYLIIYATLIVLLSIFCLLFLSGIYFYKNH